MLLLELFIYLGMIPNVSLLIYVSMYSSNLRFVASQKNGKWLLALIGWVIVVCLMKNSGLMFDCPMQSELSAESILIDGEAKTVKTESGYGLDKCELSEKLIQFAQQQLETLVIALFVGFFTLVVWRGCAVASKRLWTEPIPPKYRVHLTLCVFRE